MSNQDQASENKTAGAPPLQILAQYVRDISFENPLAPNSLRQGQARPKTKVDFGMDARKLTDTGIENMFEVILTVRAEAHREGQTIFISEVQYGTTVSVEGVAEEQRHAMLMIEIPRLAFPFVRQIICDLSVQGGYAPLLLAPVNFHALYMQRFGQQQVKKMPGQASSPIEKAEKSEAPEAKNEGKKKKKAKN
jgi:preprotein translocase subunit SecB